METNRLILRKFNIDDAVDMYNNWACDERVTKYLSWNPYTNIDDIRNFIQLKIDQNDYTFVIEYKETKKAIGTISLMHINSDYSSCEVGYVLGYDYWNQGIMTEALFEVLKFVFSKSFKKVYACHYIENTASGKVMQKCGMRKLGIKEEDKNLIYYEITNEEFILKELQVNLSKMFNENIMYYNKTIDMINYLKDHYVVKEFNFVKKVIKLSQNSLVYSFITKDNSLYNYYLICKKENINYLNKCVDTLLNANAESFIDLNGKTLEKRLLELLKEKEMKISFAESCTGGLLASTFINAPGASDVIEESYVTYSIDAKKKILGVKEETLNLYSVYSKEVAIEMAEGLEKITNSNVCLSITGKAGGEISLASDGTYDFCLIVNKGEKRFEKTFHYEEHGKRNDVRRKQVVMCFYTIIKVLESNF